MQPKISDIYAEEKIAVLDERVMLGAPQDIMLRTAANDLKQNGKNSFFAAEYGVPTIEDLFRGDKRSREALGRMLSSRGHWYSDVELDKYFVELDLAAKKYHVVQNMERLQTCTIPPTMQVLLHSLDVGKVAVHSEGTVYTEGEKLRIPSRYLTWIVEDEDKHNKDVWKGFNKQGGAIVKDIH